MQQRVAQQLEQLSPHETRAASGKDWLRGWDDWKRGQLQQQQADASDAGTLPADKASAVASA